MTLTLSTWLGACAVVPATSPPAVDRVRSLPPGVISAPEAERSQSRIVIGQSSKADVVAALGKAIAIVRFDSGYEVWVYRIRPLTDKAQQGDTEWVILFAPTGNVAKTRLRPPVASG